MSWKKKLRLFYLAWVIVVISGPVTMIRDVSLVSVFDSPIATIHMLQRITGLVAFSMLFIQIITGPFVKKWAQILGAKAHWIHVAHGIAAYLFLLIHPIMQMLLDIRARGAVGGLLTFLPGKDIYLNMGKSALVLITLAAAAGYFRTKVSLRKRWRLIHMLNYVAFIFVFIHSWNLGTDVGNMPFFAVYLISGTATFVIIFYKFVFPLVKKGSLNIQKS